MKVLLYGAEVDEIAPELVRYADLHIVSEAPDVVVCYGGDGTLLAAERMYPGVPKVPIRHSERGHRCIARPAQEVISRLAAGWLARTEYIKLECEVASAAKPGPPHQVTAMNEINVHMGRINSAVRFKMWIDDEPYSDGDEILGDGFVISTPFGSTAYFNHITRGFFHVGIGVAFKSTSEHTNHFVVPERNTIRILVTRGPAVLTYDNSSEYLDLYQDDELKVRRHTHPAVLLTWEAMKYPSDAF
jgi:NAD+ kinase